MSSIFDLPLTSTLHSIRTSPVLLPDTNNLDIGVEMCTTSHVQAETRGITGLAAAILHYTDFRLHHTVVTHSDLSKLLILITWIGL